MIVPNLKDAALKYANNGIPIFPTSPDTKEPLVEGGFYAATTDPDQIRRWWDKWPDAQPAMPTGLPTGFIVFDADNPKTVEKLLAEGKTMHARTKRGGHFYSRHHQKGRITSGEISPDLDCKADGGYVGLPPGGGKEWVNGDMPKLEDLPVVARTFEGPTKTTKDGGNAGGDIPHGSRNVRLTSIAGSMRRAKMNTSEIDAALQAINEARCKPPLEANEVSEIAKSVGKYAPGSEPTTPALNRFKGVTAAELLNTELPDPIWTVSDTVPEGLTLLVGKPKIGKSWAVYDMALAVVSRDRAFGRFHAAHGSALYLALEDNQRRLQRRLRALLHGRDQDSVPGLDKLHLENDWPKADQGGIEKLDEWLADHPDCRLVVIDTISRFKPTSRGRNAYDEDRTAYDPLVQLAAKHNVAIVAVMHLRKLSAVDPLDEINASTGAGAAADSILIMKRSNRTENEATLFITGRDIEEPAQHTLLWHNPSKTWKYQGRAVDADTTGERAEILNALRRLGKPSQPKDVADLLNKDPDSVRQLMKKMFDADALIKPAYGKYFIPGHSSHSGHTDNNYHSGHSLESVTDTPESVTDATDENHSSDYKTPANNRILLKV